MLLIGNNCRAEKIFSKNYRIKRKNAVFQYIALRKDESLSETEVLQMQNAMRVSVLPLVDESPDDDIIDTLIAVSVVSRRLAELLRTRKNKVEGDKQNEPHE